MLIYKCVVCRPQCTAQGLGSTQSIIAAALIIILMNLLSAVHCDEGTEGHRHRWVALILSSVPSGSRGSLQTLTRQLYVHFMHYLKYLTM